MPSRISSKEVERLLPFLEEFNRLSKIFLKLTKHKIDAREKRVQFLITEMTIPMPQSHISVMPIDIGNTYTFKKGYGTGNKTMDWEKNIRPNNKGVVI